METRTPQYFEQHQHEPEQSQQAGDWDSSPNIITTQKRLVVGNTSSGSFVDPSLGVSTNHPIILGMETPIYSATITLDVSKNALHYIATTSAVGNATINASSKGMAGQEIIILIANDSAGARTITFSTNFKPSATIVGTASKSATICFVSDGNNWWETRRTLVL